MDLLSELSLFYDRFDGEKGYIGSTERGKLIPFFRVDKSEYPVILMTYGIHAREYITTYLALLQIKDFIKNGNKGCVYFIPAINLDGIEIALKDKPLYKANANGVDLNVNFDARFGSGKQNVFSVSDENYVGKFPFSESETKCLRDFTLKVKPNITVSYHSKGEEIYWYFYQKNKYVYRDYVLAKKLSLSTKYPLKLTLNSAGGYKDWCVEKLHIPSFTIEVGDDNLSHPIGKEHLFEIYKKNKNIIKILTEEYGY